MTLPATVELHDYPSPNLPDVERLEQMPSWPAWVASRIGSLQIVPHRDPISTDFRTITSLPADLMLSAAQRNVLQRYELELHEMCDRVPANDASAEREVFKTVTKMMLVFPAPTQNEISAEARGEAYMTALEDVPAWAVSSAYRLWCQGKCINSNTDKPFDFHWCPAPAEFRAVAQAEFYKVKGRLNDVRHLLAATPRVEYSAEHCLAMRERLAALYRSLPIPSVGRTAAAEQPMKKSAEGAYCGTQPKHGPA